MTNSRARFLWPVLAAAFGAACSRTGRTAAASPPPNVVIVSIDTLRADRVGAYGSRLGATPNLDRLAARGAVFENAFTTAPLTLSAHASLFSGLWPFHHGARVNGADSIAADVPLLAERMRSAGLATGAVVGSLVLRSQTGLARGFDSYDDQFEENRGRAERDWNARRSGDEIVDRAAAWLDSVGSRRFFLWVHLYDPHAPYDPPAPYREQFAGRPYDGGVAYADACLGRLVARLDSTGRLGKTILLVTGDHGESLGEHGESTHGVFLYDATLRVPLVLVDPQAPRARRISTPVSLADVAPTLAEAAGLSSAPADGASLRPLIAGMKTARHRVYAESVYPAALLNWSPVFAVRSERSKYIQAPRAELFDLASDPGEKVNLFDAAREDARSLARELVAIRSAGKAQRVAAAGGSESVSRLASLGYLTPSRTPTDLDAVTSGRTDPKDGIADWDSIERAIIARQSGRPAEAAKLLQAVLARGRETGPAVLRELAQSLRQSGQPETAVAVYERLLRVSVPVAEDLFRLGVCWHMLGKEDRAAKAHGEAVALDPMDTDAWIDLGQESLTIRRLDRAQEAFSAALRLDSKSVDALAGLAAVAYERQDFASAAGRLQQALALAPDNLQTLENLARVERRRGNSAEARRLEERLAALRAQSPSRSTLSFRTFGREKARTTDQGKGGFHDQRMG
jgi:choline-sulfatase